MVDTHRMLVKRRKRLDLMLRWSLAPGKAKFKQMYVAQKAEATFNASVVFNLDYDYLSC